MAPATAFQLGVLYSRGPAVGHGYDTIQVAIDAESEALESGRLAAAWREVVARHDALRTAFRLGSGERVVQIVSPRLETELEVVPAPDEGEGTTRNEAVRRFVAADRARDFDPAHAPLARLRALDLGSRGFVALLSAHHSVLDGWSAAAVVRELFARYDGVEQGAPPEAPESFAECARWIDGQSFAPHRAFWEASLRGFRAPTPVARDDLGRSDREAGPEFGAERRRITAAEVDRLAELGASCGGISVGNLVQASWALLLAARSGERDVVFGAVRVARSSVPARWRRVIGPLIQTVPFRVGVDEGQEIASWLQGLRAGWRAIDAHELAPLPAIAELCDARPLFESVVSIEMPSFLSEVAEEMRQRGRGRRIELISRPTVPVTLGARREGPRGALELTLFHRREWLGAAEARLLADLVHGLLRRLSRTLDGTVSDLLRAEGGERRRCLVDWNDTAAPYPPETSLVEGFLARFRRQPDAPAVEYADRTLTYRELEELSARIASGLVAEGIGAGDRVGLHLERSVWLVAATLGILRAGASYLPLDPSYPRRRLETMARIACLGQVLGGERRLALPGIASLDVSELARGPRTELPFDPSDPARRPAYVMFTSGSTGEPKGVAVPHRAIVRLVCGADYIRLAPGTRIGQAANTAFDAATFELWGALLNGGTVVGLAAEELLSPEALQRAIAGRRIEVLFLTTALFERLARWRPETFSQLDTLLFGGEACDPASVRAVLASRPPRRLLHVYGPTESTTFATWHEVTRVDPGARTVPIGRPIARTRVLVVGPDLEPRRPGWLGEIAIGGDGLALEYLGAPEATARAFRDAPEAVGGRLFLTGDLGLQLEGGTLLFAGRRDRQVKLRGHRIELEEVEAALARVGGVAEVAVRVRSAAGEDRLVAWVVPPPGAEIDVARLRAALAEELPPFMVPAAVHRLPALPLTPNGKVDDRALVELSRPTAAPGRRTESPLERRVAEAWKVVLGLDEVGAEDDFFALGGDSLRAVRVAAILGRALGREVLPSCLLEAPTLEGMAHFLGLPDDRSERTDPLVALTGAGSGPALCFVHGGYGRIGYARGLSRFLGGGAHFGLVPPPAAVAGGVVGLACCYLEALRTRCAQADGLRIVGRSSGGLIAFEMAVQAGEIGAEAQVVLLDTYPPGHPEYRRRHRPPWQRRVARWLPPLGWWRHGTAPGRRLSPGELAVRDRLLEAAVGYAPAPAERAVTLVLARDRSASERRSMEVGWREVASRVEIVEAEGGHDSMFDAERRPALVALLRSRLDDAAVGKGTLR